MTVAKNLPGQVHQVEQVPEAGDVVNTPLAPIRARGIRSAPGSRANDIRASSAAHGVVLLAR